MFYKISFYFSVILFFLFISVSGVNAADFTVSPSIITETAQARNILEYSIVLESKRENGKLDIYAIVNDISADDGIEEFKDPNQLSKENSIALWTKIKRSIIELQPGEKIEVPLKIEVNMSAVPGNYYARIAFASASSRKEAEEMARSNQLPTILLNIKVVENNVEKAKIQNFKPKTSIFIKFPLEIDSEIENFGNRDITPEGTIFIYNRRGQEEAQLEFNPEKTIINPNNKQEYRNYIDKLSGIGKFKARLEISYGEKKDREVQDTVYFWVLPWHFLAIFLGSAFFIVILAIIFLFKKSYHHSLPQISQQQTQQTMQQPMQKQTRKEPISKVKINVKKKINVKEEE